MIIHATPRKSASTIVKKEVEKRQKKVEEKKLPVKKQEEKKVAIEANAPVKE